MHWIGIGFLIAVGFGLAAVALPIGAALLALAWEMRRGLGIAAGVIAGIILLIVLLYDNPDAGAWLFWIVAIGLFAWWYKKGKPIKPFQKSTIGFWAFILIIVIGEKSTEYIRDNVLLTPNMTTIMTLLPFAFGALGIYVVYKVPKGQMVLALVSVAILAAVVPFGLLILAANM